jgi:hypothetical protein
MSGSSVGSSSEVNSPVSFTAAENTKGKIKELDETRKELDIEGVMDKSHTSRKDSVTQSGGVSRNIHQLCVIITEAAEENDRADNAAIDVQIDKARSNSKKEKEKFHVSIGEWRIIMSAINHGTEVPANLRREVLMGYQYALHQHKKRLREKKTISGEVKKTIVCQVEHIEMNTAKHQSPAEKDTKTQSIVGEQQHGQGKKTMQGA